MSSREVLLREEWDHLKEILYFAKAVMWDRTDQEVISLRKTTFFTSMILSMNDNDMDEFWNDLVSLHGNDDDNQQVDESELWRQKVDAFIKDNDVGTRHMRQILYINGKENGGTRAELIERLKLNINLNLNVLNIKNPLRQNQTTATTSNDDNSNNHDDLDHNDNSCNEDLEEKTEISSTAIPPLQPLSQEQQIQLFLQWSNSNADAEKMRKLLRCEIQSALKQLQKVMDELTTTMIEKYPADNELTDILDDAADQLRHIASMYAAVPRRKRRKYLGSADRINDKGARRKQFNRQKDSILTQVYFHICRCIYVSNNTHDNRIRKSDPKSIIVCRCE